MEQYRFLMIGAHPDDIELCSGGLALKLRKKGHSVMFLSMTDGSAGHQHMERSALAARRKKECEAVAKLFDVAYHIMPFADAELEPTLEARKALMRVIRSYAPHVIFTHRTVDYHPDHRACGQLVMDCSYLVNVPLFCPEAPCPPHTPVIFSLRDDFTRPLPFQPDLVVPIDDVLEKKIDGALCHVSQFYEWLPHVDRWPEIANASTFEEKTILLRSYLKEHFFNEASLYPELMPEGTHYAEVFEWNEYGGALTDELRRAITEP